MRRWYPFGSLLAVGAVAAGLYAAGRPVLFAPGWRRWSTPPAWAMGHGVLWAVAAALWFATLGTAGYLLALGSAALWCRRTGRNGPLRWIRRLTPPPLRLMLGIGLGIATAATSAGAVPLARRARPPDPAPVLRLVGTTGSSGPSGPTAAGPSMRPLPTGGAPSRARPAPPGPMRPPQGAPLRPAPPANWTVRPTPTATWTVRPTPTATWTVRPTPTATWTIRPGDHLWAVADATLSRAWGRTPDARTLGSYWWTLVQLNRPRLPDPANPDLVYPGDLILLPPAPPPPSPAP